MREHTALIEQIALYLGRPWKFNALEQESCWQRQIIDGQGRGLIISKAVSYTHLTLPTTSRV